MLKPGSRANGTNRMHLQLIMPSIPPAPAGLSQQQLKRRHIVAAIVHSENSYVATLQRLVNVSFIDFLNESCEQTHSFGSQVQALMKSCLVQTDSFVSYIRY